MGNQSIASTTLPEEVNISNTNDQLGSSDSMIRQIPHESQHSKLSSKDIAKNNTALNGSQQVAIQSNASTTLPQEVNRQELWKSHAMNWSKESTLPREDSKL